MRRERKKYSTSYNAVRKVVDIALTIHVCVCISHTSYQFSSTVVMLSKMMHPIIDFGKKEKEHLVNIFVANDIDKKKVLCSVRRIIFKTHTTRILLEPT
jgi:hypothetical protein